MLLNRKYYKEYAIYCSLYSIGIKLIHTDNFKKVRKKYGGDYEGPGAVSDTIQEPILLFLTTRNRRERRAPLAEIIAHEASHVADQICLCRGIKHDFKNPEPYAYLVGWITRQICDRLKLKLK